MLLLKGPELPDLDYRFGPELTLAQICSKSLLLGGEGKLC